MTRKQFILLLIGVIALILGIGAIINVYILSTNNNTTTPVNNNPNTVSAVSPTPTPEYLGYLNEKAQFVGTIVSLNLPTSITIEREDLSTINLLLEPNIPIYVIEDVTKKPPKTRIETTDSLNIGQTMSVYANGGDIRAIFIEN